MKKKLLLGTSFLMLGGFVLYFLFKDSVLNFDDFTFEIDEPDIFI